MRTLRDVTQGTTGHLEKPTARLDCAVGFLLLMLRRLYPARRSRAFTVLPGEYIATKCFQPRRSGIAKVCESKEIFDRTQE